MPGGGCGKDISGTGNSVCKGRQRKDPGVQGMASDLGCLEKEEVAETTLERRVRAKLGGPRMPAKGVET